MVAVLERSAGSSAGNAENVVVVVVVLETLGGSSGDVAGHLRGR